MTPEAKVRQTIDREVEAKVETTRKCAQVLRRASLSRIFNANYQYGDHSL